MSLGVYFSLRVIGAVGLILSTTVGGGVGTVLGIGSSVFIEGLPDRPNAVLFLTLTTLLFIVAGFLSSYASYDRDKDRGTPKKHRAVTGKVIILMLLTAVLTNGWAMGTAEGVASALPPVLTALFMAIGSFLSVLVVVSVEFTLKKQWKQVLCIDESKKPLALIAISAVCHYGGNMISIYSMSAISATISFLLGKSSALWTVLWGMLYREFSDVSGRTKRVLYTSIALYFIGIIALAFYQ